MENDENDGDEAPATPPKFEKPDDLPARSVTGELVDPSLVPLAGGGRPSNYFARLLSASRRITIDAKRMEVESVNQLSLARMILQETVEKATKMDARHEQLDNIMDAERVKVLGELDAEYKQDMADIEDKLIDLYEREVKRGERRAALERRHKRLESAEGLADAITDIERDRESRKVADLEESLVVEDFERKVEREKRFAAAEKNRPVHRSDRETEEGYRAEAADAKAVVMADGTLSPELQKELCIRIDDECEDKCSALRAKELMDDD